MRFENSLNEFLISFRNLSVMFLLIAEIFVGNKVVYFPIVIVYIHYYYGVTFVSFGMLLPAHEQDGIRYQVAHNLQKLHKQQEEKHTTRNWKKLHESKIIKLIKTKLNKEGALITKADKGNTIIIMWDTVALRDIQLQYSNDNSIYLQQFGFTLSKKQKERSEAGTGTELN